VTTLTLCIGWGFVGALSLSATIVLVWLLRYTFG